MKFSILRRFLIIISVFICLIGFVAYGNSLPTIYSSELPLSTSIAYDILDSNGEVTFWGQGTVKTEIGGKIQLRYVGAYTEWDQIQPFFNITFFDKKGYENITITNTSNSNLAMTLILGFGTWQPGFFTPKNWSEVDQEAINIANSPPSDPWSMNGTLSISSENGIHIYDYCQNVSLGDQSTVLRYKEENGLLIEWQSTFWGYYLHARIQQTDQSSSPFDFLPGFPLISTFLFIGIGFCFILIKNTNKRIIQLNGSNENK